MQEEGQSACPYCSRLFRLYGRHGRFCRRCALWVYRNALCRTLAIVAPLRTNTLESVVLANRVVRLQILDLLVGTYDSYDRYAAVEFWQWFLLGRFDQRWNQVSSDDDEALEESLQSFEGVWPEAVLTLNYTQPLPYFWQLFGLKLHILPNKPKKECRKLLEERMLPPLNFSPPNVFRQTSRYSANVLTIVCRFLNIAHFTSWPGGGRY